MDRENDNCAAKRNNSLIQRQQKHWPKLHKHNDIMISRNNTAYTVFCNFVQQNQTLQRRTDHIMILKQITYRMNIVPEEEQQGLKR